MAPNMADFQPAISKPSTKAEVIISRRALMTKEKRPNVKMLMGRVKSINKGRIRKFMTPIRRVARIAAKKLSSSNPLTIWAVIKRTRAERTRLSTKFNILISFAPEIYHLPRAKEITLRSRG
jgi:hypothetical protein